MYVANGIYEIDFLQAAMVKIFIWPIILRTNLFSTEAGCWCIVISEEVENWVGSGTMME